MAPKQDPKPKFQEGECGWGGWERREGGGLGRELRQGGEAWGAAGWGGVGGAGAASPSARCRARRWPRCCRLCRWLCGGGCDKKKQRKHFKWGRKKTKILQLFVRRRSPRGCGCGGDAAAPTGPGGQQPAPRPGLGLCPRGGCPGCEAAGYGPSAQRVICFLAFSAQP